MGFKLLVSGGRDDKYDNLIYRTLDRIHEKKQITDLIHGAAKGVDTIADKWAKERGVTPDPYPVTSAHWNSQGKKAGHLRNGRMITEGTPDGVLCVLGWKGTWDMLKQARRHHLTVMAIGRRSELLENGYEFKNRQSFNLFEKREDNLLWTVREHVLATGVHYTGICTQDRFSFSDKRITNINDFTVMSGNIMRGKIW